MSHVRPILGLALGLGLCAAGLALAQEGQPPVPAPAPTPEEAAAAKLEVARAIAKQVQTQLQKLTPRRFAKDVGVLYQSDVDFRAFMRRTMTEEMPPEKLGGLTDSWVAFGFVPEGTDLAKLLEDAMSSQALAYYDPKVDTFFIVKELAPDMLRSVMLHELEHAIQAQRFQLVALQQALMGKDQSDRLEALRFLWEGEATFVMMRPQLGTFKEPHLTKLMRAQADAVVQTPYAQLLKLQELQLRMSGAKDIAAQMEATRKIPPFLLRSLQLAYLGGAAAVHAVHAARGWEGVDALWQHPPTSTEQALHPEKLLGETREEPVEVAMPDLGAVLGEGFTARLTDTMGESSIWLLLADQLPAAARGGSARAAAGWGGDRYAVWKREGGRPLLAWLTVWDRDADAVEFAGAYAAAAAERNPARNWPAAGVRCEGRAVAVVEGADDAGLATRVLDTLIAATPALPPPAPDPAPPEPTADAQIRDRIRELAGVLSSSDPSAIKVTLDRQFFSDRMPISEDGEGNLGRENWKQRWTADLGTAGCRCVVASVVPKGAVEDGALKGGNRVETEWRCGVPNARGERVRFEMVWFHEDGFWKVARIKKLSTQADVGPPPADAPK